MALGKVTHMKNYWPNSNLVLVLPESRFEIDRCDFFALGRRFQKWLFSKDELQEIETGLNFFVPPLPSLSSNNNAPSTPESSLFSFSLL